MNSKTPIDVSGRATVYPDEPERLMVMVGDLNKQSTIPWRRQRSITKSARACRIKASGISTLSIVLRRRWLMGSMRYSMTTGVGSSCSINR